MSPDKLIALQQNSFWVTPKSVKVVAWILILMLLFIIIMDAEILRDYKNKVIHLWKWETYGKTMHIY
jgi:hypothetical protein